MSYEKRKKSFETKKEALEKIKGLLMLIIALKS